MTTRGGSWICDDLEKLARIGTMAQRDVDPDDREWFKRHPLRWALLDRGVMTVTPVAAAFLAWVANDPRALSDPTDGRVGGQRLGGRGTSTAAMDLAVPKAGTQRARVLDVLENVEGLTDVEIHNRTWLPLNSVRPRRVELCDAGWVHDTGERRKHHGRDHVVWGLTPAARAKLNGRNNS